MATSLLAVPRTSSPPPSPDAPHPVLRVGGVQRANELLALQWAADDAYAAQLAREQRASSSDVSGAMSGVELSREASEVVEDTMPRCDSPTIITSDDDGPPPPSEKSSKSIRTSARKRPINELPAPALPASRTQDVGPVNLGVTLADGKSKGRGRGSTKEPKGPPPPKDVRALRKQFPTIGDYARNLASTPRTASRSTVVDSDIESQDDPEDEHSSKKRRIEADLAALTRARVLFVSANGDMPAIGTKVIMDGLHNLGATIHDAYVSPQEDPIDFTTHIVAVREGTTLLSMRTIVRALGFSRTSQLFGATANLPIHAQRPWIVDQLWANKALRGLYDKEAAHLIERKRRSSVEPEVAPPMPQPEVDDSQDSQGSRIDSYSRANRGPIAYAPDHQTAPQSHAAAYTLPTAGNSEEDIDITTMDLDPPEAMDWSDLKEEIEQAEDGKGDEDDEEELPDAPKMPAAQGFVARDFRNADDSASDEEGVARKRVRETKISADKQKRRANQEKWACQRVSIFGGSRAQCPENQRTVDLLTQLAEDYDRLGEYWRLTTCRKVVGLVRNSPVPMKNMDRLRKIHGIGDSMARKIAEIFKTGKLIRLENLSQQDRAAIFFARAYGIGPSAAGGFARRGARTLDDLKPGNRFGIVLTEGQQLGVKYYDDLLDRMKREEAGAIHKIIEEIGKGLDPLATFDCMGSYRRGQPDCGDIDILVSRDTADGRNHRGLVSKLVQALFARGLLKHTLSSPSEEKALDAKWMGLCSLEGGKMRRIDILGVPHDELGAALIYFTGNDIFNRSLRLKARKMGYSLNQRGVFQDLLRDRKTKLKVTEGKRVPGLKTEHDIFSFLGVKWRPPHHRLP